MASIELPELDALANVTQSALSLLDRFKPALAESSAISGSTAWPENSPQPLAVLHTAATLLKAHSTKLSLLILNKPFTPSAIRKIVSEISSTCLPAMMNAVEICRAFAFGDILRNEIITRVRRAFLELESMFRDILVQVNTRRGQDVHSDESSSRDTLSSTGVVWEACDSLIELQQMGLVGLVITKVQEYRDMLVDAMAELKEWSEDVDDDDDGEELTGSDDDESLDNILEAANRLPKNRQDLHLLLAETFKKLKLLNTLFQALIKRRLRTIPASLNAMDNGESSISQRYTTPLNSLTLILKTIPGTSDELASSFYDLNADEAKRLLEQCCTQGRQALGLVRKSWTGEEDEFTVWSTKWLAALNGDVSGVTKS